jgi:hypothetical protein
MIVKPDGFRPAPVGSELLEEYFVRIAPAPFFARLQGFDYGMLGRVKMLGGVSVFGRVAAAYMAAGFAQSQVHPPVAHLQAFLAPFGRARRDVLHLVQVRTILAHILPLSFESIMETLRRV